MISLLRTTVFWRKSVVSGKSLCYNIITLTGTQSSQGKGITQEECHCRSPGNPAPRKRLDSTGSSSHLPHSKDQGRSTQMWTVGKQMLLFDGKNCNITLQGGKDTRRGEQFEIISCKLSQTAYMKLA